MKKVKHVHQNGDTRIIERFAFFPVEVIVKRRTERGTEYHREIRWLEKVKIKQKLIAWGYEKHWVNKCFIDDGDNGGE